MTTCAHSDVDRALDHLLAEGWVVVPGALSPDEVAAVRTGVAYARSMGWEDGLNAVGNMWFDTLLDRQPDLYRPLVGHPSIRPHLERLFGPQCQLRSLRAHINPGAYLQEWHLDFFGYWREREALTRHRLAVPAIGVNTTFYLQDNHPGVGRLTFVARGHLAKPPHVDPTDQEAFDRWCYAQEHVVLHPRAGDCVLFLSHIPHQGAKEDPTCERSNIVCHYQVCPMHERVLHVSQPRQGAGLFPVVPEPESLAAP